MTRFAVRAGEERALALACLAFFCVLAAYYVIRPVRDQLAGAVGSIALPMFYAGTFAATLLITPLFGALVARLPRRRLLAWSYLFFTVCLIAFVPLFMAQDRIGARTLGVAFFVWVSVFNLFVVSLFWSLMADICSSERARRLFPLIAIGGTAGAIAGPLLTSLLVQTIGVAALLLVSAGLLSAGLIGMLMLSAGVGGPAAFGASPAPTGRAASEAAQDEAPVGGSLLAGVRQVLTRPFLRNMALLMLLSDGVGTVAYAFVADYAKAHFLDNAARTAFYAHLDLATNTLVVLLQLAPTRWLLARRGPAACVVAWATINVLLLTWIASAGGVHLPMPWLAVSPDAWPRLIMVPASLLALMLVVSRGFTYGMLKPASDALYTRVEREARYKGKNFIDTAVWRFGDLTITSALSGLRALGIGLSVLAALSAGAGLLAGWFGWRAAHSRDLAPEPADTGREDQPAM